VVEDGVQTPTEAIHVEFPAIEKPVGIVMTIFAKAALKAGNNENGPFIVKVIYEFS
jgi:hypothetical protein